MCLVYCIFDNSEAPVPPITRQDNDVINILVLIKSEEGCFMRSSFLDFDLVMIELELTL